MICSLCAAENPIDGRYCLKCGALLQGQRAMPPQPSYQSTIATPYSGLAESSGKAVGSLICGLLLGRYSLPSAPNRSREEQPGSGALRRSNRGGSLQ